MYKSSWEKRANDVKENAFGRLVVIHGDITLSWILEKFRRVLKACVLMCFGMQLAIEIFLFHCGAITKEPTFAAWQLNNNLACNFEIGRGVTRVAYFAWWSV